MITFVFVSLRKFMTIKALQYQSGIPVLQGVISDVGIKRGTSHIKPLNIKIPPCTNTDYI